MLVVDTSSNNGPNVPWQALRDHHGVAGGIVKLTQGTNYVNPDAARDWKVLGQLGMERGGYLWADPRVPPANTVLFHLDYAKRLGGYKPGEPIFVDFEQSLGYSRAQCDAWLIAAEAELDKVAAKQPVGVYASDSFLRDQLGISDSPWQDYLVWDASYGGTPTVAHWYGHQFTDSFAGMSLDCSTFPRGLTVRTLPPAHGKMTPELWRVALAYVHTHYAPALWGHAWTTLTSDPANAYAVLKLHKLAA